MVHLCDREAGGASTVRVMGFTPAQSHGHSVLQHVTLFALIPTGVSVFIVCVCGGGGGGVHHGSEL